MHTISWQLESALCRWLAVLLFACALCSCCRQGRAQQDMTNPESAIEIGRDSLSSSPNIPWYDSKTDDYRAAKVEVPRPPRPITAGTYSIMQILMWLGWIVLVVLLLTIVYLLLKKFLNREVQSSVVVEESAVGADIVRVEELPVALKKSPADYLDEAQRLYRKGDYQQAIVYLFSHQLLQLDRRHWLRLVKGKTNRQYLREIRRNGTAESEQLVEMFNRTVLLFEEVFFGKRLPAQDKIEAVWRDIDRFESLVLLKEQAVT